MKKTLAKLKTWQLLLGLLLMIAGSTLFIVGVSGGFGESKAVLDEEFLCKDGCSGEYMQLNSDEYEKLIEDKKTFVVFVDQDGCKTADKLEEFLKNFATNKGFRAYKMMYSDVKKTSMYDFVKYYPSVAIISRGKVIGWLKADSDNDSDAYNQYEAFEKWINKYLALPL